MAQTNQIIPDQNHGNTPCNTHENQPLTQFLLVGEKSPGETQLKVGSPPLLVYLFPPELDWVNGFNRFGTMISGATIQLTTRLNPSWIQTCLVRKMSCSVSYWTLHRMGYIMTRRPMAFFISLPCQR